MSNHDKSVRIGFEFEHDNIENIVDKYSLFLTRILIEILTKRQRLSTICELILSKYERYIRVDELVRICMEQPWLTSNIIQSICQSIGMSFIHDFHLDTYSRYVCFS
jgi:hypothetical protein